MDLVRVERELKRRWRYPYRWGRKQSNAWDHDTNFIYTTYSVARLLTKTERFEPQLRDYALNRWYNFWSAMAAEHIFASHKNVKANRDRYDKLVDFTIDGIPFDHKTTVFPKGFNKPYTYAREHGEELIMWLYQNQSQEARKHLGNRLFILLYDEESMQHWKMKAEVMLLKQEIEIYMKHFSRESLYSFDFGAGRVYADILWIKKEL